MELTEQIILNCKNFPNLNNFAQINNKTAFYFEYEPGDMTSYRFSLHLIEESADEIIGGVNKNHMLFVLHGLTYKAHPIKVIDNDDFSVTAPVPAYLAQKLSLDEYTSTMLHLLIKEAMLEIIKHSGKDK
jgi:hypothetical protein